MEEPREDPDHSEEESVEFDLGFGKIRIGGSFPGMEHLRELARWIESGQLEDFQGAFEPFQTEGGKVFGFRIGPFMTDPETFEKLQDLLGAGIEPASEDEPDLDLDETRDAAPEEPPFSQLMLGEDGCLYAEFDLPGIGPRDVLVALEGDRLYVHARSERRRYRKGVHLPDGPWDEFDRSIEHGLLTLRIHPAEPEAEE